MFGFPIAPAVIGLILGPIAEEQLRRTLAISQGDPVALVDSPFAIAAYASIIVLMTLGLVIKRRARTEVELTAQAATPAREPSVRSG